QYPEPTWRTYSLPELRGSPPRIFVPCALLRSFQNQSAGVNQPAMGQNDGAIHQRAAFGLRHVASVINGVVALGTERCSHVRGGLLAHASAFVAMGYLDEIGR